VPQPLAPWTHSCVSSGRLAHRGAVSVQATQVVRHLAGPPTSMGFDTWASSPQRGLGREISRWRWSRSCRGGHHDGSSPTIVGVSCIRGRVRPTPADAFRQLRSGDGVDLRQLVVHLAHSIDGGRRLGLRGSGRSSHGLDPVSI
jgi:hypothetical protein